MSYKADVSSVSNSYQLQLPTPCSLIRTGQNVNRRFVPTLCQLAVTIDLNVLTMAYYT